MKLRAIRAGLIRVATPKGERSRLMEPGMEFDLPDNIRVPRWAEVVAPAAKPETPAKPSEPKKH